MIQNDEKVEQINNEDKEMVAGVHFISLPLFRSFYAFLQYLLE